jgi:membrane-associated phospholipid phosphatase
MFYDVITNSFFFVVTGLTLYKLEETVLITFTYLLLLVYLIKITIKKPRPDHSDQLSFPSGHSATAWFFVVLYHWNPIVVFWAISVTVSRVVLKKHDEVDVAAGTLLGILISMLRLNG